MSTRVIVWLAVVSNYAFIAFIAGLFGPLNWFIAPYLGFMFCKWGDWRLVWTMSLSLSLGGLLGWLVTGSYIVPFYQLLLGSTLTVLLFLSGALVYQIQSFIRSKGEGSTPSDPSSSGNSMFRRLLPKWKQEERNPHHLQSAAMPTA